MGPGSGTADQLYVPAHHGPYFLHAQTLEGPGHRRGVGVEQPPPVGTVRVFRLGSKQPIATYNGTAVCKYNWESLREFGIEHSLHLIPRAKLLVIVPGSRDELRLYPADLDAAAGQVNRPALV